MSHLIGVDIYVTLKQPPKTVIQGRVAQISEATHTLVLKDVVFIASGQLLEEYSVKNTQIEDITVVPQSTIPAGASTAQYPEPYPSTQYAPQQNDTAQYYQQAPASAPAPVIPTATKPKQTFVDPAILSYGRKPSGSISAKEQIPPTPQEAPSTPIKPLIAAAAAALPANTSPFIGMPIKSTPTKQKKEAPVATLTAPFSATPPINTTEVLEETDANVSTSVAPLSGRRASVNKTRTGKPMETPVKRSDSTKKPKRGGRNRNKDHGADGPAAAQDASPEASRKANGIGRGKGWRSDPLLQNQSTASPRTPGIIGGQVGLEAAAASNRKTRRQRAMEAQNGWATEDATDIQELPEFDFAANLSKFDKRSVFDQIRNEDTTADEDRLVNINRLPPRPGTYGGKNLHPTENVLDSARTRIRSSGNSSDTEDEISDFDSGRNSRRSMSRTSVRRPVRQGSKVQDEPSLPATLLGRTNRSFNRSVYSSSHATGSPKIGTRSPPLSPYPDAYRNGCFRLDSNNRICNVITPGGMAAVEEVAEVEFKLSEDIMAENAGRGLAEVALGATNPGGRRLASENLKLNPRPVIVVLAGNHRSGARAIAAARHLHARGLRVLVFLLGYERPADWDKDVRRQSELFRNLNGYVRGWDEVERKLKKQETPPELIIDALLGRNKEFLALADEDREMVFKCVGWANKSRASVLSVETPSGIEESTGEKSKHNHQPVSMRSKLIVCSGAPRTGLLKALQNRHVAQESNPAQRSAKDPEWLIWVVDIGVNKAWKTYGGGGSPGAKLGVPFGDQWVSKVRFTVEGNGDEAVVG